MVQNGRSFWPLLLGRETPWRAHILYEYYWEANFPATPTILALRTERWKYVHTLGVWDKNGLYDLLTDPLERHNLINVPSYREQIAAKAALRRIRSFGRPADPDPPPAGEVLDDRKLPR